MTAIEDARAAMDRIEELWRLRLFGTALKLARSTINTLIAEVERLTGATKGGAS